MTLQPPPPQMLGQFLPVYRFMVERERFLESVFPGPVTSWWRSPFDNRRVGGSPDSQHLLGFAFDVVPKSDPRRYAALARQVGLIAVEEFDHVHLQVLPAGAARQFGLLPL